MQLKPISKGCEKLSLSDLHYLAIKRQIRVYLRQDESGVSTVDNCPVPFGKYHLTGG